MTRQCVVVFGPPCTGKSTAVQRLATEWQAAVPVHIGDYIRSSEEALTADQLAEQALDRACAAMPPGGILIIDGIKRASHVSAALSVLARHKVQLLAAVEMQTLKGDEEVRAGRDDTTIRMRWERYFADRPQLISAMNAVAKVCCTRASREGDVHSY